MQVPVYLLFVGTPNSVKYLGVRIDCHLNLQHFIAIKCKTAMYSIIKIRNIRKSLTVEVAHTLVLGIVISHLDYANALYINLPDVDINKLQRIQNIAAKLVLGSCKYDSATECLHYLHWLPVRKRIQFKVLLVNLQGNSIENWCTIHQTYV